MITKTIISSTGLALMLLASTFANAPIASDSAASSSASSSPCGFHSGFRAGVGLGYQNYSVQNKYDYAAISAALARPGVNEVQQKTSAKQSAIYQVHLAYDWIKHNWLLSLEFDYRYNPSVNRSRMTSNSLLLRLAPGDFVFEQSHHHDFGLGFRVGRTITSRFSIYGIANIRLGQFRYKFINQKNIPIAIAQIQSAQRTIYRWGGGLGLGCQYALSHGFSIGPEITYDIYQPVKINQNLAVPNNATLFVQSSRPKIFNAVLKLSKTF